MRLARSVFLSVVLLILLSPLSFLARSEDPDFKGRWDGNLMLGDVNLHLIFRFSMDDGQLVARLDSPDQRAYGFFADAIEWEGANLRLVFQALDSEFVGMLDEGGEAISGTWRQAGQQLPLVLHQD
ncbi:hypothetical protein ACXYTJ_15200 [Gilvimarinus sp. F26214L]|uniref:hypothetical protein n=1 Tax=Gilvimarinus sp. DZF01 TaxID=3461371 RepID=UPI00404526BE